MTRIALVGHRFGSRTGTGVGRYYVELVRGLASLPQNGHRFVAATTREADPAGWLPGSVERRFVPGPRKAVTLSWAVTARLPRVDTALGHPDIVHAMHAWAPVPSRAPLVVTVHDVMPLRHPNWYPRLERWSFSRAIDIARDRAVFVITDSASEAAVLTGEVGIDPARIRVVPLGVADEFRARFDAATVDAVCERHGVERGRYLISVGAVSPRKNLSVVLRALAEVDEARLGRPALLVVGPRWRGSAEIETEIVSLGLDDRVRFAGYVAGADLPALLAGSLALVHPSRDEGFGMTPLEAMAAGVPALVSDSGSLAEIAGPAAVVLDPDDPTGWRHAIETVATDTDHRAALVAAGRRHQAAFTWQRTARDTLDVYDAALEGTR